MSKLPSGIDMPNRKKPVQAAIDLMRPGNGTPWEDRGNSGALPAYFKTVIKSFTSPGLLMDHIRRPETTRDAWSFAITSGVMWFVGILAWNLYWLYFIFPNNPDYLGWKLISPSNYWLMAFLQAFLVALGIWVWLLMAPKMYKALAGAEMQNATPTLIFNCFAYSMGPSLLAVIPLIPKVLSPPWIWVLAATWIHFNLVVAGKRRLYLKGTSAIINVILIWFCVLAISVVGYYVGRGLWAALPDMSGFDRPVEVTTPHH